MFQYMYTLCNASIRSSIRIFKQVMENIHYEKAMYKFQTYFTLKFICLLTSVFHKLLKVPQLSTSSNI